MVFNSVKRKPEWAGRVTLNVGERVHAKILRKRQMRGRESEGEHRKAEKSSGVMTTWIKE